MNRRFRKIYIEITNVCNLKCRFCPSSKRAPVFMTCAEFEHILLKVKNYTDLISLHVKGEPLMHMNLKEILEICESSNIKVNLTTNGTLLKDKLDILLNSKSIRQINVSIHSVMQNDNLDVNSYLDNVFECCDILKNKKIISYRLWNLSSSKDDDKNKYVLEKLGKRYGFSNLYELAKSNIYIKLDDNVFLNQDVEFKWPDICGNVISKNGTCLGLKKQIAILSNGDVVPCCLDQDANILLGNILDKSLEDILSSPKCAYIIDGFNNNKLNEKLCQTCGFRKKFDKK